MTDTDEQHRIDEEKARIEYFYLDPAQERDVDVDHPPYFPDLEVKLVGSDSNSGAIMGAVTEKLREAKVPTDLIDLFRVNCMGGNYEQLLRTVDRWVKVTGVYRDHEAISMKEKLDDLLELLEEIIDWAEGEGYRAVTHKLEEASGPLQSAVRAAEQYAVGDLQVDGRD